MNAGQPVTSELHQKPHQKPLPIVLVTSCLRTIDEHPFEVVGRKYLNALRGAGCLPLIVPAAQADWFEGLLELADGLMLTGSPSNVNPKHYGESIEDSSLLLDSDRDAWTLPFIRRALKVGLPLLGICRGAQETNVALGGSLHQNIEAATGSQGPYQRHQCDKTESPDDQYGPAHRVDVVSGGLLERIVGKSEFMVNSLHDQGIRELAPGLHPEALASDGLIEAFSLPDSPGFNLCVQWHPEWKAEANPVSLSLFSAFADACRAHRARRF